ncbi:MAG: hypothetical protein WC749_04020 [Dehalococcoidia bacterium]
MSIPFRDDEELEELGAAAYLKIEIEASGYRGALFLINGRGEPMEYTYTRIEIPNTFLWRKADIHRYATRKIAASLFSLCPETPKLIFCLAEEAGSELFCQDISVSIPVCRVAPATSPVSFTSNEVREETNTSERKQLFWFPAPPAEGSIEYSLFQRIISSGLLSEPFERAEIGLREVYK